jgi:hypothetical protein
MLISLKANIKKMLPSTKILAVSLSKCMTLLTIGRS